MIAEELLAGISADVEAGIDILPIYNHYKKFKKMHSETDAMADGAMWADLSTIKGLDQELMIQWIMSKSDLTFHDLLHLDTKDPHALTMIRYATQ